MTEDQTVPVEVQPHALERVEMGVLRASSPADLVTNAAEVATALAGVVKAQGLSVNIQGHEYVKAEGWATLAAMLGVTPHEESSVRLEDGSYEATVKLVRINDGAVIGRASALCGMDEDRWANGPEYARKSMAATRATGKACRLAFSWIMPLAGFKATPAEEMDGVLPRRNRQPSAPPAEHKEPAPHSQPDTGATRRTTEVKGNPDKPASPKQTNWVKGLAKKIGMSEPERDQLIRDLTGKDSLDALTNGDVSVMIPAIEKWVKPEYEEGPYPVEPDSDAPDDGLHDNDNLPF